MATKSAAEKRHEEDIKKLDTLLKRYKDDYDLCDEGFEAFIAEANLVLNKKLTEPVRRSRGNIHIDIDVGGVLSQGGGYQVRARTDVEAKIESALRNVLGQMLNSGDIDSWGSVDFDYDLWSDS